jgi:serine/threonine protein kinase
MGATYKAFRVRLGDYAVVKVMHGHLTNDPAFGERFSREAQAAAQRVPRRSETERPRVRGNGRRGNAERHLAA